LHHGGPPEDWLVIRIIVYIQHARDGRGHAGLIRLRPVTTSLPRPYQLTLIQSERINLVRSASNWYPDILGLFISLIAILLLTAATISAIWYTHSRNLITNTMLQSTELLLNERNREINTIITNIDYQSRLLSFNNASVDRGIGDKWKNSYLNIRSNLWSLIRL
jgi:hypothetical protein